MAFENYHPSLDDPNVWVPYRYYPSVPAASVFVALFALVTLYHCALLAVRRTWFFLPFIIGGIFELVGYVGRIVSAGDIWALGPFIIQSLLLLIAPALFAASIYIVLGRIILVADGEHYSYVPRRWLTKAFVTGDVISFMLQLAGMFRLGEKLIIAGLFAQITFFGLFIVVAVTFHVRYNRHTAAATSNSSHWVRHMYALYGSSLIILIRSIFRVVEYIMGNNGPLLRYEYFLYIFDAALMFLVMVLLAIVHPSQLVSWKTQANVDVPMRKSRWLHGRKHDTPSHGSALSSS
ncbi:RTA1-domain-containing protein [Thozetella sp. PMI_491]|nr:RTA1-domain-containing protein [Thozetella sp. PMI_491]